MLPKEKNNKFKLLAIIIFALGFLFLLLTIFLYTPWFKNSRYYKVYQAEKTLNNLPVGSQAQKAQAAYIQCLKSGQTKCSFNEGASTIGPGPSSP
jgi:flagellar basal body-associated protein FliL